MARGLQWALLLFLFVFPPFLRLLDPLLGLRRGLAPEAATAALCELVGMPPEEHGFDGAPFL